MNYTQKRQANRDLRDSFKANYPCGCVKITSGESIEHARTKLEVCHWLQVNGYDIYTEAKLSCDCRADIIAIKGHIGYIIEILFSESDDKFLKKLDKSYGDFMVIPIKVSEFSYKDFKL